MAPSDVVLAHLKSAIGFEPVTVTSSAEKLLLYGRVRAPGFLPLIGALEDGEGPGKYSIDISKRYRRPSPNVEPRYGWRFIISSKDLPAALEYIARILQGAPRAVVAREVTEGPLVGASMDRNAPRNGKGAGLSGSVAVGAAAINRR